MDNKMNKMLNNFFKEHEGKSEEDIKKALSEFMDKFNNGEIEYEETPLDKAYQKLETAERTKNKKTAIKLAKEAYEICDRCFDAIIFQASMETNIFKMYDILNKGLEYEKSKLEEDGFFDKDNIGHFYGLFETRPYMRGLSFKAFNLVNEGKLKQAMEVCKEAIRLNESDNMGLRYMLMAIYAALEDEKSMLELRDKYDEDSFEMLFPIMILYYKLGDYDKAKKYLDMVNKVNTNLKKYIKGNDFEDEDCIPGYFRPGSISELEMYYEYYGFLLDNLNTLDDFILEYSKK